MASPNDISLHRFSTPPPQQGSPTSIPRFETSSGTPRPVPSQGELSADHSAGKQKTQLLQAIADRLAHLEALLNEQEQSKTDFIWNATLQFLGTALAIAFGVCSVLAYVAAIDANKMTAKANQLALLALCLSSPNNDTCSGLSHYPTRQIIQGLTTDIFGNLTQPVSSTPPGRATGLSTMEKISIGVGIAFGFPALIVRSWFGRWNRRF